MPVFQNIGKFTKPSRGDLSQSPIESRKITFEQQKYLSDDAFETQVEQVLLPVLMDEEEIRSKRAFEWVFGRNLNGELSLGVKKNALVPAYVIGLKDVSTK